MNGKRKQPAPATIKKLFALSGNLCAFPECPDHIVNTDGSLIGQICHIEAAEKGGERYNPQQTDEERAQFENLILLCANHHIVTNNEEIYTVAVLREMKAQHEANFLDKQYTVPEKALEDAITQTFTQVNNNTGLGQQINGQLIIVNQHGLAASDVISIVKELYETNFLKLAHDEARKEAKKNIAKFEKKFYEKIAVQLTSEECQKFSDPDVQVGLYDAIKASARKDNENLREMLTSLVIERVKNDDIELKQKVLNEAIATVSKITVDQMKILTLCFNFKHSQDRGVLYWEDFKLFLDKCIKPFIDFKGTQAEILHLQYAGCGRVGEATFQFFDLSQALRQVYTFFFLKGFEKGELDTLGLPSEILSEITTEDTDNGKIYMRFMNTQQLKDYLGQKEQSDFLIKKILSVYEQNILPNTEIQAKIDNEVLWMKQVFEKFHNTQLNQLSLTSVGMAIAIAYFEQVTNSKLDIDIWIN